MPSLPSTVAHLLIVALLAGCQLASVAAPNEGPSDSLRIGSIDPEWIRIAGDEPSRPGTHEQKLSAAYPDRILRWGNLLALKLDNGKFLWLVDMAGTAGGFNSVEIYHLKDYWPDLGMYIVKVEFSEKSRHWLVSARTAKVIELRGAAYRDLATPNVFIATGTPGMGSTEAEVWEGQGENWVQQYKCNFLDEDAEFLRWDGSGRAILAAPQPIHRTREFLLTKTDGKWHTDACKDP